MALPRLLVLNKTFLLLILKKMNNYRLLVELLFLDSIIHDVIAVVSSSPQITPFGDRTKKIAKLYKEHLHKPIFKTSFRSKDPSIFDAEFLRA